MPSPVEAFESGKKIFKIIDTKSKINAVEHKNEKIENFKGEIEFKKVWFRYPMRRE
jgi:ABC-type multidrug transport system fused ATPase/permease subunit